LQYLKSGKIKAIALTSNLNLSTTEQIPTFSEMGYPNLSLVTWSGIFAPKKTSSEVIAKLNQSLALTLADPNVQTSLKEVGQIIYPKDQLTSQYLENLQQKEIEKWWPIIKEANINGE
jgi:tripartite-type tricarboxylate transporter receptor subunit TctC